MKCELYDDSMQGWKCYLIQSLEALKEKIELEGDYAWSDFSEYKAKILGVEEYDTEKKYPYDEFHCGMERCVDIIKEMLEKYKQKR